MMMMMMMNMAFFCFQRKLAKSEKQTQQFEEQVRTHAALLGEQRANNQRNDAKVRRLISFLFIFAKFLLVCPPCPHSPLFWL